MGESGPFLVVVF